MSTHVLGRELATICNKEHESGKYKAREPNDRVLVFWDALGIEEVCHIASGASLKAGVVEE